MWLDSLVKRKGNNDRKILNKPNSLLIRSQCTHLKDNSTFNIWYCTISLCENVGRHESCARSSCSLSLCLRLKDISLSLSRLHVVILLATRDNKKDGSHGRGISLAPFGDRFTPFSARKEERRRRSCMVRCNEDPREA